MSGHCVIFFQQLEVPLNNSLVNLNKNILLIGHNNNQQNVKYIMGNFNFFSNQTKLKNLLNYFYTLFLHLEIKALNI